MGLCPALCKSESEGRERDDRPTSNLRNHLRRYFFERSQLKSQRASMSIYE